MIHDPDATLAAVRNRGAIHATGDWLLFLDADDELSPGFREAMEAAVTKHKNRPMLLTPAVSYVYGRERHQPKFWPPGDIRDGNWMVIGTLIRRDLFHEIGGFRDYGWSEDWDLWARAITHGCGFDQVQEAVYIAHVDPKSRNRSAGPRTMLYWHQRIGFDNWPDLYHEPTQEEDEKELLATASLRRNRAA